MTKSRLSKYASNRFIIYFAAITVGVLLVIDVIAWRYETYQAVMWFLDSVSAMIGGLFSLIGGLFRLIGALLQLCFCLLLLAVGMVVQMVPSIVAQRRNHPQLQTLVVLNVGTLVVGLLLAVAVTSLPTVFAMLSGLVSWMVLIGWGGWFGLLAWAMWKFDSAKEGDS